LGVDSFLVELTLQIKYNRTTPEQIIYTLKQADSDRKISVICRRLGVSEATFYNWREKYVGMIELGEFRQLQEGNNKLKQLVADLSLDTHMLQEVLMRML